MTTFGEPKVSVSGPEPLPSSVIARQSSGSGTVQRSKPGADRSHRLLNVFAKLRESARKIGAGNTALYALDRILRSVSGDRARLHRYYLVAQPVREDGIGAGLRPDGKVRIEEAGPDHRLRPEFPRPPAVIEQRYAQGAHCLVADSGGTFAGYLWWGTRAWDEDEVRCRFALADPTRCVWDFDVYVEPRFRLGRTMARLWHEAAHRWYPQGVRWSFSRISVFNIGSLAAHGRLGLRSLGSALFVVVGPCQLALFGQPPYVHFGMTRNSRPTLILRPPGGESSVPDSQPPR
jgi:hypothetical protein